VAVVFLYIMLVPCLLRYINLQVCEYSIIENVVVSRECHAV